MKIKESTFKVNAKSFSIKFCFRLLSKWWIIMVEADLNPLYILSAVNQKGLAPGVLDIPKYLTSSLTNITRFNDTHKIQTANLKCKCATVTYSLFFISSGRRLADLAPMYPGSNILLLNSNRGSSANTKKYSYSLALSILTTCIVNL